MCPCVYISLHNRSALCSVVGCNSEDQSNSSESGTRMTGTEGREKKTLSDISTTLPFYLVIIASTECEILPFRLSSDLHPFCSGLNSSRRCKTVKNRATGMH